jgi:hypothetical protein
MQSVGGDYDRDDMLGINRATFEGPGFTDRKLVKISETLIALDVESLDLWDTSVTPKGLWQLQKMPSLRHLSMAGPGVTDVHVRAIRPLRQIDVLELSDSSITDASMPRLRSFPMLVRLDLANTQITDAAIDDLATLTSLRYLNISNTKMTSGGIERLRRRLPRCELTAGE